MKFSRVLLLIIGGILLSATWQWSSSKKETLKANPQIYADEQETEAKRAAKKDALQDIVNKAVQKNTTKLHLTVVYPKENLRAGHNDQKPVVAASLYKLFVAYEVYHQVDDNKLNLNDRLSEVAVGKTINECLKLMITVSDNDCGKALGLKVGWAFLDKRLREEGYPATVLNNYDSAGEINGDKYTSASDVAKLLVRLYNKELLSPNSSTAFIDLLKQQKVRDRLPRGLPAGTVMANKNGELYGYMHDAGVVYGAKAEYIIVLMTGEWANPTAQSLPIFKQVSQDVWGFLAQP